MSHRFYAYFRFVLRESFRAPRRQLFVFAYRYRGRLISRGHTALPLLFLGAGVTVVASLSLFAVIAFRLVKESVTTILPQLANYDSITFGIWYLQPTLDYLYLSCRTR